MTWNREITVTPCIPSQRSHVSPSVYGRPTIRHSSEEPQAYTHRAAAQRTSQHTTGHDHHFRAFPQNVSWLTLPCVAAHSMRVGSWP